MIFITLSSPETVHDTEQYRYCIYSLLSRLLRIRLKRQIPLLSHVREKERERKDTVNVQSSVQYTLILLYLKFTMSYCA
jgi:hypothetical protein